MKKFYYSDGKEQFGPFTLDELKEKGITADTLVWYQGLEAWMPAAKAPYLKEVFGFSPPAVMNVDEEKVAEERARVQPPELSSDAVDPSSGEVSYKDTSMPRLWLIESILVTLFCCLPFGIVGIVFASQVESKYNEGDKEGAQEMSRKAGQWTKTGFITGLIFISVYLLYSSYNLINLLG